MHSRSESFYLFISIIFEKSYFPFKRVLFRCAVGKELFACGNQSRFPLIHQATGSTHLSLADMLLIIFNLISNRGAAAARFINEPDVNQIAILNIINQ